MVSIARPKIYGGWGIKNPFWFNKALAAKSLWRLAHNTQLWGRVMVAKYFPEDQLWIGLEI
jgi:hypothetical protein